MWLTCPRIIFLTVSCTLGTAVLSFLAACYKVTKTKKFKADTDFKKKRTLLYITYFSLFIKQQITENVNNVFFSIILHVGTTRKIAQRQECCFKNLIHKNSVSLNPERKRKSSLIGWDISPEGTLDFKWWGWLNGGKIKSNPKISLDQNLTPKKSHAKFPSLKNFQ